MYGPITAAKELLRRESRKKGRAGAVVRWTRLAKSQHPSKLGTRALQTLHLCEQINFSFALSWYELIFFFCHLQTKDLWIMCQENKANTATLGTMCLFIKYLVPAYLMPDRAFSQQNHITHLNHFQIRRTYLYVSSRIPNISLGIWISLYVYIYFNN